MNKFIKLFAFLGLVIIVLLFFGKDLSFFSDKKKQNTINIAVASNLRFVMEDIKTEYLKEHPNTKINLIFGSSGTLTQQIIHGAPFSLFISADTNFPEKIKEESLNVGNTKVYCYGKLIIWSKNLNVSKGLDILKSPEIKKIAIANPDNAPYGKQAVNMLKHLNIYDKIKNKIIWGENINQTAQFVLSGNAEIGFIALSTALSGEMKNKGNFYILPEEICPPIKQGAILIKNKNEKANEFLNFITNKKCEKIWSLYGYKQVNE